MKLRSYRQSWWWSYGILLASSIVLNMPHKICAQPIFYTALRPDAFSALEASDSVDILKDEDAYWGFYPKDANRRKPVGFIFYPGCFYDERAYAPLLRILAELGYPSFLLDVPVSFSILTPFRADTVVRKFPEVESWVLGGHGLGGMVASIYTQYRLNAAPVRGLVLLSSYPLPIFNNLSRADIVAVSIWGNLDGITSRIQWEDGSKTLPSDTRFIEIDGGNYSQMAWLSTIQNGDNPPTISRNTQQTKVLDEIKLLLAKVETEFYGY